jgi:N-acetylmuramoyl-L-alanine amidase CwlA
MSSDGDEDGHTIAVVKSSDDQRRMRKRKQKTKLKNNIQHNEPLTKMAKLEKKKRKLSVVQSSSSHEDAYGKDAIKMQVGPVRDSRHCGAERVLLCKC